MIEKKYYDAAPKYCHSYFDLIASSDVLGELEKSRKATHELFGTIPPEKENYAYRPGKWTTKEVIKHIIDCERVYAYRALRFSRFDPTELPGFDENLYTESIKGVVLNMADLKEEFELVRKSTLVLYKTMTDEMLDFKGVANKMPYTARTLGLMAVGHNVHHCNIIKAKYLA